MAGFGETLRREREMRGVTLEEISATTKISTRFLEALEEEEFSKLPGGIFTRSFIRAYANYLGLDEERVMAEYQLVAPSKGEMDLSRIGHSAKSPPGSRTAILTWAVVVAMMGGGYALFRYSHRPAQIQVNAPTPVTSSPQPSFAPPAAQANLAHPSAEGSGTTTSTPPVTALTSQSGNPQGAGRGSLLGEEKVPSSQSNPSQPNSKGSEGTRLGNASSFAIVASPVAAPVSAAPALSAPRVSPAQEGLVLQVAATEQAWVDVQADGKTIMARVLNPQEVRTFQAKDAFDVNTGNAQGIILTLNGETLKPLGRSGEVKKVHLTRDDLKNSAP